MPRRARVGSFEERRVVVVVVVVAFSLPRTRISPELDADDAATTTHVDDVDDIDDYVVVWVELTPPHEAVALSVRQVAMRPWVKETRAPSWHESA